MTGEPSLRWTGHTLVDVGLAGFCALVGKEDPEALTLDDLDEASDFIERHYFSGALDPYLSVVFTNNSGYCGPNKSKAPREYAEVYRAHRTGPSKHLVAASGRPCCFSGLPGTAMAHRQHLPLFSAAGVMNFRPEGETAVPVAGPILVALQFAPMAARRAEGRMLAVHADDPAMMLAFARRYLEDNRRLLSLQLPTERLDVHPAYEREQPMWDAPKKRHKMADAKAPRSLVLADLTDIASRAMDADLRPHPVALTVYILSNSGQGPSLEQLVVPSGVVAFVRSAARSTTRAEWQAIASRFRPARSGADDNDAGAPARSRKKRKTAPIPGRAGWSRNPAFEDLCRVYESGFLDRRLARTWLARYVLGRLGDASHDQCYERTSARTWALARLFLQEVLGMKTARIEAVRRFADKLAEHVHRTNDRRLLRAVAFERPGELRRALLAVQRQTASAAVLFGLDEYAAVWLHEDGDEYLVRDLVAIRLVERLAELGYFKEHPEETLDQEPAAAGVE